MLTVIATLCSLAAPADCHDVVVASGQPLQACYMAQAQIADLMNNVQGYRLGRWRCEMGKRAD